MLRNWRAWVLLVLFAGPLLAYVGFGAMWLWEHGWLLIAGVAWMVLYLVFAVLSDRWTRSKEAILPPLDWTAPKTFTPRDRSAWAIVEEEADTAESAENQDLNGFQLYASTGQRLAERLAAHYFPNASHPVERVPVVELLTALELAAEDLRGLCREVPGGDLITPGHFQQAVQAAGFLQKANEIYTYLLPVLSPVTGLARLGSQKWIAAPAWKNAQRSAMLWFYRAYVNRLGVHLIELYSGRLAIGADAYRTITRRGGRAKGGFEQTGRPTVVVAGVRGVGKSLLMAALEKIIVDGVPATVRGRLAETGDDPALADRLKEFAWLEVPGYPNPSDARSSVVKRKRDHSADEAAEDGDLLLLLVDASRGDPAPELEFLGAFRHWFDDKPSLEPPPTVVVVTGLRRMAVEEATSDAHPSPAGTSVATTAAVAYKEAASAAWVASLEARLPEPKPEVLEIDLDAAAPAAVGTELLPELARRLPAAERQAMLRHFHRASMRSKAWHVLGQVGKAGKRLWGQARAHRAD